MGANHGDESSHASLFVLGVLHAVFPSTPSYSFSLLATPTETSSSQSCRRSWRQPLLPADHREFLAWS